MQDNKDVFRRIERQYYRDRMGTLGLSTVEGMLLRWLGKQGQTRQEDLVVQLVLDKGRWPGRFGSGWRSWAWWSGR